MLTEIAALKTGQLIKDEFFTLFEAVGALEVIFLLKFMTVICWIVLSDQTALFN